MTPVLLDTHALIWLTEGDLRLGHGARDLADRALAGDALAVSAISYWEVAMLQRRAQITLAVPVERWRQAVRDLGVAEAPVSGDIALCAVGLDGLPADPADRLIAATALLAEAVLLTADDRILGWSGRLQRHDARL